MKIRCVLQLHYSACERGAVPESQKQRLTCESHDTQTTCEACLTPTLFNPGPTSTHRHQHAPGSDADNIATTENAASFSKVAPRRLSPQTRGQNVRQRASLLFSDTLYLPALPASSTIAHVLHPSLCPCLPLLVNCHINWLDSPSPLSQLSSKALCMSLRSTQLLCAAICQNLTVLHRRGQNARGGGKRYQCNTAVQDIGRH